MNPAPDSSVHPFRPDRWIDWQSRDPNWQAPFLAGPYQNQPAAWARRLDWSTAPLSVPSFRRTHETEWPIWWKTVDWACQLPDSTLAVIQEVPFSPCLAPLVAFAVQDFPAHLQHGLAIGLIKELSAWSHRGLYAAFDAFRRRRRREASATGDHFTAFAGAFTSGPDTQSDLIAPGLRRLLALLCVQWRGATWQILMRLARDEPGCPVLGLESSVADRHHGGKRVVIVTLAPDRRLVYKPRSMEVEAAFYQWLEGWNALPAGSRPPGLPVRCGHDTDGAYGWMEFVRYCIQPDPAYHQKAGALLFLMHLLGGSDLHMENVIASAAGPVLIDLECLLQPCLALTQSSFHLKSLAAEDGIGRTGLLPVRYQNAAREWVDVSGFGGTGCYQSPGGRRKYLCLHRSLMSFQQEPALAPAGLNQPGQPPWDFVRDIQLGYQQAYDAILSQPDLIKALMEELADLPMRYLLRPTTDYGRVLKELTESACLANPLMHAATCESLAASWAASSEAPPAWPAVDQEIADLDQYDIPVFHVHGRSVALFKSGTVIVPSFFAESGYDAACRRLAALPSADLKSTLAKIALSLTPPPAALRPIKPSPNGGMPLGDSVRETVLDFSRTILSRAANSGGRLTWPESAHSSADPAGVSIYGGTLGTALFLAAAGTICGDTPSMEAARQLACEAASALEKTPCSAIGGFVGTGSAVLAFNLLATLTGDPSFRENAERLGGTVSRTKCQADSELDLLGGLSGWIASLVDHAAFQPAGAWETALSTAVEALLQRRSGEFWKDADGRILSGGLAHGAGGPALALSRSSRLLARPDLAQASLRALASEAPGFDPALANWPLAQATGGRRTAMNAWCNGAAGLMAAATEIFTSHGQPDPGGEPWRSARKTLLDGPLSGCDHVCCGNAGRLGLIQSAGASPAVLEAPAMQLIQRWQRDRSFRLDDGAPSGHAGLFRGLSGIGWVLLRIAFPLKIPDLLLLRSQL